MKIISNTSFYLCFFLLLFSPVMALAKHSTPSSSYSLTLDALYNSLSPLSITQHLAFYELYPETEQGKRALAHAWQLLSNGAVSKEQMATTLPSINLQNLIFLITRSASDPIPSLEPQQLDLIDTIASCLSNRSLKGHEVWSQEEILALNHEEIDLARGLLLFQFDPKENPKEAIRQYEASIDLMALQIKAALSPNASHEEKIAKINHFIFQEMQFRFPPHSLYANDIDLYTFLPSVLDSRQGVCLGVSILYLCIAQRLDLPLEIITPPGHIYLRYRKENKILNIETTARGIDLPSETYLGINTRKLQERNMKEVIGLAFMNQASVFFAKQDFITTLSLYEKAQLFVPNDPLLKMLLGLQYLFNAKKAKGTYLLREICDLHFEEAVSKETIPQDYLQGHVDLEGIQAVFLPVDEKRESILEKQKALEKILKKYPKYRAGLLQLATTWLQLGRQKEATEVLQKYYKIDPNHAVVTYYLTVLSFERLDYTSAWKYLKQLEKITRERGHYPKILLILHHTLCHFSPEPLPIKEESSPHFPCKKAL